MTLTSKCSLVGCDRPVKSKKGIRPRKYCSAACSLRAHKQQLTKLGWNRAQVRAANRNPFCVKCGNKIENAVRSNQKYCGDACAALGMIDSIRRQRERRLTEKGTK